MEKLLLLRRTRQSADRGGDNAPILHAERTLGLQADRTGAYRAVATVSNGSETLVIRKDFVLPELTNPKDIYHTLNWRAIDFDKVIQYYIDFYSDEACTEKLSLQHSAACHYIVWRRHHDAEGNPTKNDKVMEDTVMLPAGVTTYNLPYTFEAKDYLTLHGYRYDYEIVGIEYR